MRQRRRALAQAVGLWLAEGDKKTRYEVTFTNNNPELVRLFHRTLWTHFRARNPPRIYVYLPSPDSVFTNPVRRAQYRTYIDERANSPYYIYRVSGVELVRDWRKAAKTVCDSPANYQAILQGFFAGEGNIKHVKSTQSRVLRIAQGKRLPLLEKILNHFGIPFSYESNGRSYVISGRTNLESLFRIGVSKLHSKKQDRFTKMLVSYKQYHYGRNFLSPMILNALSVPMTTRQVADRFERSQARATQLLSRLLEKNEIEAYRVRSTNYWVRSDANIMVISMQKFRILAALSQPRRVFELSKMLNKDWKSISRRLAEMERLGLVEKTNSKWHRLDISKRVIVK